MFESNSKLPKIFPISNAKQPNEYIYSTTTTQTSTSKRLLQPKRPKNERWCC